MPNRPALRRLLPAACLLGLLASAAASAGDTSVLLPPTPLVLKDGRIARVTVHTIPFPTGKDQPDETARSALTGLVDELATDCFLTAQAIGHVEPGPGNDGETLAAHRLARARADRVQAALIGRGLPASSIASVWDWQFAVREPRVTLWVFRLAEGDDCDSRPIAQVQPTQPAQTAVAAPPAVAASTPVADPAPVAAPATPTAPEEPVPPAIVAAPATSVPEEAVPLALAAPEPEADPPPAPVAVAEAPPPTPEPAPVDTTPADAAMAITFDINSSYFPKGTSRELKALAERLAADNAYEIVLEGTVSAEAVRSEGADEGHAYNRWIADRRMSRVADWLRQHTNGGGIEIKRAYVENDPSRRVTIRVRPLP